LQLEREVGNRNGVAQSLSSLGWLALFKEEYADARPYLEESLALFEELGDRLYLGICVFFLGRLATDTGDYATARRRFGRLSTDLPLARYRWTVPRVLDAYARLAAAEGRPAEAVRLAGCAAGVREAIGASEGPSWAADLDRRLRPAWSSLGEATGRAIWDEGRAMPAEQALAYAVAVLPPD
jgi:hypothetical protein